MTRSLKVLVVDDDAVTLEVIRGRLEDAGHEVVTHDRGVGTSQMVVENKPDVLLLDINMPFLKGDKLLNIIRNEVDKITVILHSAQEQAALNELVQRYGVTGAIRKSASTTEFLHQFNRLVVAGPHTKK